MTTTATALIPSGQNAVAAMPTPALSGPVQATGMPTALMTLAEIKEAAQYLVGSGLFGIKTVEQAATLMMLTQAIGKPAIQCVLEYDIINGRPARKAAALQADFIAAGGRIEWLQRDADVAEAVFSHSAGGTITVRWDMEMAGQAGLLNKQGPWQQYKRSMLSARCISEGVRTILPGVALGMYTPEEVAFFEPQAPPPPAIPAQNAAPAAAPRVMAATERSLLEKGYFDHEGLAEMDAKSTRQSAPRQLQRATPEPPADAIDAEVVPETAAPQKGNQIPPLSVAQNRFLREADRLTIDVKDGEKWSLPKALVVLTAINKRHWYMDADPQSAAHWHNATPKLPDYLRETQRPAPALSSGADDVDASGLGDPFAE